MQERRSFPRQPVFMVIAIDSDHQEAIVGVGREVSLSGLLMGSPHRLEVGEQLNLELQVEGRSPQRVSGHVVRSERNREAVSTLWRYVVAVRFSGSADNLRPLLG